MGDCATLQKLCRLGLGCGVYVKFSITFHFLDAIYVNFLLAVYCVRSRVRNSL